MSLARNPDMPYVSAGRQSSPYERMNVRSHVYVPDADVREDCDGRPAYTAPAGIRREPFRISVRVMVAVVAVAMFVMAMLAVSAMAKRAGIYKEAQSVYSEIQSLKSEIGLLEAQIAQAQEPNNLRYQASQRLGMINSEGVEPTEIYAPDTRPATADFSLSAGSGRTSPGL